MSIRKRIGLLISCVALFLVILVVTDTYSKYLTEADGTANIAIARWRRLVNGQDIRNNTDLSQVITPVFYEDPDISNDIIAPRSKGYFDIIIDCRDADVSFEYNISTSPSADSSVSDLIATGYSIDGGSTINLSRNQHIINQVPIASNPETISIRIYIEWYDDEDEDMDNTDDTNATKSGDDAKMDVNLSFKQIVDNS